MKLKKDAAKAKAKAKARPISMVQLFPPMLSRKSIGVITNETAAKNWQTTAAVEIELFFFSKIRAAIKRGTLAIRRT